MNDEGARRDKSCDICGQRMTQLATLPASGLFPQQHVYKCSPCGFATAVALAAAGSVPPRR